MTIINKVSSKSVMPGVTAVPDVVDAPTIGSATAGIQSATVTYTAAATGGAATSFTAISTPGSITGSSATSPITVSGLTAGTAYTFKVYGANSSGTWSVNQSSASNSVTPASAPAFESIATVTLTGTQSSITFSSIPSTFTHLQLRYSGLSNNMGTQFMEINGDTNTANYRTHVLYGTGASVGATDLSNRAAILGGGFSGQFSTTYPMVGVVDFLDYTNTAKYKTVRGLHGTDTNNTGYSGEVELVSGVWFSGSAITQLRFFLDGGMNFTANSKFALYGIKVAS